VAHPFLTSLVAGLALSFGAAPSCEQPPPAAGPETKSGSGQSLPVEKLTVGGSVFTVKLALDDASRQRGLGGVSELKSDEGMLFVFPDPQQRFFWMKDCLIDIDIAFIDPFGFVTATHTMAKEELRRPDEPMSAYEARLVRYRSLSPAQFALELAPGTFEKLGIKRGSKIELDLPRLKAAAK
jgi:uncharacterized membrane protein (UPF0127 family)